MKKKFSLILACVCLITVSLVGCGQAIDIDDIDAVPDYPVEVSGLQITQRPEEVAVLSSSYSDIISALGYDESVVLVNSDNDVAAFEDTQKVEDYDVTTMINAGVDLVIAETLSDDDKNAILNADIPLLVLSPAQTRSDFERLYGEIGSALEGASKGYNHAITTARSIFTSLDDLSRIIPEAQIIKTVAMIVSLDGQVVTGLSVQDTVISYCGLSNVFKGISGGQTDFSSISIDNPSYIFCPEGLKDEIMADSRFSNISAVLTGNVYEMPLSYFTYSGRTLVSFATTITGVAYPELLIEESTLPELPSDFTGDNNTDALQSQIDSLVSELPQSYEPLNKGDSSDSIKAMKNRLIELGYLSSTNESSEFDDFTEQAIKDFQTAIGEEATGLADTATLIELYDLLAPVKSE